MLKKPLNILFVIFIISLGLRLVLAFLNREANDNHIEVINWILYNNQLPEANDCAECFMPKLFYIISAGIIKLFHLSTIDQKIIAVQLLNVIISFFILLIFWKFIKKQPVHETIKIITFAFFAFNPCLAAINIQATNDTLEIFSGVLAIYFADSFLKETKFGDGLGLMIAVFAAALTKGTGLLLFATISLVFVIKIFSQNSKQKKQVLLKYFLVLFVTFCSVVPFAGGYYNNFKKFNSLSLGAWNQNTPPSFFKPSYVLRPGLTDMFHGWFTLRLFDMMKQPYINNDTEGYPMHRTSLWSQLYGRTVFLHFDQWPPSWQTHNSLIINVGRILILLGVIPLVLFLRGLFQGSIQFMKNIVNNGKVFLSGSNDILHLTVTVSFLSSSLIYSYYCRDFSAMKSIYIFPGFISFIKLFLAGFSSIKSKSILKITAAILIVVMVFSIFDIGYLLSQLYEFNF